MTYLNNKSNNNHPVETAATAATISVLAIAIIMLTSTTIASPVAATTTTASAGTTTSSAPSSGIKLSPHPIYQERAPPASVTPINQTHISATHSGNGTLTLPNSTQTINTTSNGTVIV